MRGFTKVVVMGNLTRDPELRSTASGQSVASFGIAVNRGTKDKEEVSFFDCSAWGKPGEIISQYMKKGRPLLVSGQLRQRTWEDKNGGGKRSAVEIVVDDFTFLGDGNGSGAGASAGGAEATTSGSADAAAAPQVDEAPADITDEIDLSEVPF